MRLINADRLKEVFSRNVVGGNAYFDLIDSAPTVEAIPKDQYENRLKADMVAMLEELKEEIIELPFPQKRASYMQGYNYCQMNILDYVIQEKINELMAD